MEKPWWMWIAFIILLLGLLILDLGIIHRRQREISATESILMSVFYISISLLFSVWIWYKMGAQSANEYLTGFLIEKSLSLDNILFISLIFSFLKIPIKYQHRVLFFGIIGVIILRAIMIILGAKLIAEFNWILYIFAVFLIIMGIKMFLSAHKKINIKHNLLLKFIYKHIRILQTLDGKKFFTKKYDQTSKTKKIYATPLFVALIIIEFTDIIFAVDSIPAIFLITTDPYIVFTSNMFAILGLRALYFALVAVIHKFKYMRYALAAVLIFIGSKVFIPDILGIEKFPVSASLSITFGLLLSGVLCSFYKAH